MRRRRCVLGGAGFLGSHLVERLLALDGAEGVVGGRQPPHRRRGEPRGRLQRRAAVRLRRARRLRGRSSITGAVDYVFNLASPGLADRLREAVAGDDAGGLAGHAERASSWRRRRRRRLPPGLDLGDLRRPAGAPAARGLPGQRRLDRAARGVRRGQALRRGAGAGVPRASGVSHPHRAHLQHLRPAHAARTTGGWCRRSSPRRCAGEDFTVFGDGTQTRSFCYVRRSGRRAGARSRSRAEQDPVNIGNPDGADHAASSPRRCGRRRAGAGRSSSSRCRRATRSSASPTSPARRRFSGWEPKVTLAEGLKPTLEYFRKKLGK